MKTSMIALLLVLFTFGQVHAQKIYSTKAATVRFIVASKERIEA